MNGELLKVRGSNTVVIFIHGLEDSMHSPLFRYLSEEFSKQGISSYKYNVFASHSEYSAIYFSQTSFSTYVDSLNELIRKQLKAYGNVYLVGHSFGGLLSLLVEERVSGYFLLEPSLHPSVMFSGDESLQKLYSTFPSINDLMGKTSISKLFIFASLGGGEDLKAVYGSRQGIVLDGADHNFTNLKHRKILVEQFFKFLKKRKS